MSVNPSPAIGHFESKALEARDRRRREATEFSEDDVSPIRILEVTRGAFSAMPIKAARATLAGDRPTCFFLHDETKEVWAMVIPPSFIHLLEVAEVLRDRRKFMVVPEFAAGDASEVA